MPAIKWLIAMTMRVGRGRIPPIDVNIFANVGTTKIMITAITKTATLDTTMG